MISQLANTPILILRTIFPDRPVDHKINESSSNQSMVTEKKNLNQNKIVPMVFTLKKTTFPIFNPNINKTEITKFLPPTTLTRTQSNYIPQQIPLKILRSNPESQKDPSIPKDNIFNTTNHRNEFQKKLQRYHFCNQNGISNV